jgi:altronate dehydratase
MNLLDQPRHILMHAADNVPIGYALKDIPAGSWVHERLLKMPAARELEGLPMATANPALGFATHLLVRAGASVMFFETTEVREGIDQLTSRASSPEVAEAMIREMAWYDAYLKKGRVDRSANTTPGNKNGGLSNIVEKTMDFIVKSAPGFLSSCWTWPMAARKPGPSTGNCTTHG